MTISEKASYIKGLMDGMKLDKTSDEGKLFAAITDLLEDLSLSVSDLEDETSAMREYIDELDTDLSEVETELYGIDEDEDADADEVDDEEVAHDCVNCDEEDCVVSLECPACGSEICIEACELEDCEQLECPSCGQLLNVVCTEEEEDEEEAEEAAE